MTAMPEPNDVPEVLFVCVHNAGRSQMAAALLEHHAGGRVRVRSAGTTPSPEIHPNVVEAMAERGLDVSTARPKGLREDEVREVDVVITMGCGDACPVVPGTRYLDWDLPDPTGKPIAEVRPTRDDIERRVLNLLRDLAPED
jgi:arsenate reductase (thioredoxin)